ncbi:hypothetical protein Tco_0632969 [Tanacetum coccineum]
MERRVAYLEIDFVLRYRRVGMGSGRGKSGVDGREPRLDRVAGDASPDGSGSVLCPVRWIVQDCVENDVEIGGVARAMRGSEGEISRMWSEIEWAAICRERRVGGDMVEGLRCEVEGIEIPEKGLRVGREIVWMGGYEDGEIDERSLSMREGRVLSDWEYESRDVDEGDSERRERGGERGRLRAELVESRGVGEDLKWRWSVEGGTRWRNGLGRVEK